MYLRFPYESWGRSSLLTDRQVRPRLNPLRPISAKYLTGQADFHGSTQIHLRDRFRSNKKISVLPSLSRIQNDYGAASQAGMLLFRKQVLD